VRPAPSLPENLQGLRALHRVRLTAAMVFALAVVINGPLLHADSIQDTICLLALAGIVALTGAGALVATTRGILHASPRGAMVSVTLDMVVVTTTGLFIGGVHSTLPLLYMLLIGTYSLCLQEAPLIVAVVSACGGYLALAWTDAAPPPLDTQIVVLSTYALLGMAAAWTVRISKGLVQLALDRQRARLDAEYVVARYFSPRVGEVLLNHPTELITSQRRVVTTLFADLAGFTALGEAAAQPASEVDVLETLDAYLDALATIAIDRDGTVDNYLGDGILVVFNAPLGQPDHARLALETAAAMQTAAFSLSTQRTEDGRPVLGLTIGINTGDAVVGPVGGKARVQYTVIGDSVNVASRLQAEGEAGEIIVGQATAIAAGLDGPFEQATVRGRQQPVHFMRLRGTPLDPRLSGTCPAPSDPGASGKQPEEQPDQGHAGQVDHPAVKNLATGTGV